MSGLDFFTWFVLIIMGSVAIIGFIVIAQLPGKIATEANHPQVAAINMAGWLGLIFTAGIVWIGAMIWANLKSGSDKGNSNLSKRVEQLEAQLQLLTEVKS